MLLALYSYMNSETRKGYPSRKALRRRAKVSETTLSRSVKKLSDAGYVGVEELVGDEYLVIGEFKGIMSKVTMRHNSCGYEWEVIPSNFLRGNRCLKCSNRIPITTEMFMGEYVRSSLLF